MLRGGYDHQHGQAIVTREDVLALSAGDALDRLVAEIVFGKVACAEYGYVRLGPASGWARLEPHKDHDCYPDQCPAQYSQNGGAMVILAEHLRSMACANTIHSLMIELDAESDRWCAQYALNIGDASRFDCTNGWDWIAASGVTLQEALAKVAVLGQVLLMSRVSA